MNNNWLEYISSHPISIISNELTKNLPSFYKSLKEASKETGDAAMCSQLYALKHFAPTSEANSIAVHKKIDWTTEKLAELQSQLPINPIQSVIEQATERLHSDINEHFKGILKKRGISEDDWRKYGSYGVTGKMFEYYYKDECIFRVTHPESELNPGETSGNMVVYYWEVES